MGAAWLPAGVATIGQILPPGAAGTLVRSVAYFGGTGGQVAALTLGAWAIVGLLLWIFASLKRQAPLAEQIKSVTQAAA